MRYLFLFVDDDRWRKNCPPLDRLTELLIRKSKLASSMVIKVRNPDGSYYYTIDAEAIRAYNKQLFGKFQRIDESEPPPGNAYYSLVETLPGIIACMHARYAYERNRLKNMVLSIEGGGGAGKSSMSYWLVKLIGGIMANDEESLVKALQILLEERKWVPILVLDDIGAIASKYWFLLKGEKRWANFFRLLEYSKDWTGLILLTERRFTGIAKKLREMAEYNGSYRRMLMGEYVVDYIIWRSPDKRAPSYIDVVWAGLSMEERDWERMREKRREIGLKLLTDFVAARGAD